jgi:ATP-dependent protease HslVU (ClpYQ) peptidase subunit
MTLIIGITQDNQTYMGGDAAASSECDIELRQNPKVFYNGAYMMGYTTSFRMGQLLQYELDPKNPTPEDLATPDSIVRFMVTEFIPQVRTLFDDSGFSKIETNVESAGNFIVAVGNYLFGIESDYQVGLSTLPYLAVGSGAQVARGSLYTTQHLNMTAQDRIAVAMEAAQTFVNTVAAPVTIIKGT